MKLRYTVNLRPETATKLKNLTDALNRESPVKLTTQNVFRAMLIMGLTKARETWQVRKEQDSLKGQ